MMDMYSSRSPIFLLGLGLLLVRLLHGAFGITVKNSLSNSHPRLGGTITMKCSIADGIAISVTWYKDRLHKTSVYLTHNCEVVAEGYKSRLKNVRCRTDEEYFQLSNVQISDGGDWQCEANGVPATANLKLYVLVPHNVQVKVNKTTVNEHEFVRFECDTSGGNPELVTRYQWLWMKNGSIEKQVIQDSDTNTKNGKFVEFTRIPYDKSGTYTCKAWNDVGMGQASAILNVQYSPRIDPEAKMKSEVAGKIGQEAMFELFIIANPTPVTTGYTWSKDGNVLSRTSPDYEITSWPTSSKLKINDVKSSDHTNYSCSVKTIGFQAKVFNFKLVKAVSYTSESSNIVQVKTTEESQTSKGANNIYIIGIGMIAGGGVAILVAIGIVVIAIKSKEKSRGKKKSDNQELQNNVVTGPSVLLGRQVNHGMRHSPPRSECDPDRNRNGTKSKLRTPDVVSDTQKDAESALQNVPDGKSGIPKGGRPPLLASSTSQPASPVEEHLYEDVKRKSQPQQNSGSGGVPKQIGVDGTVYAKLSFQPANPKYELPVRRTEQPSPYSTVDFNRKAPPLEEEEEALVQYIT
ncbi:neural cell adhesion molecule 1-like isoform X2 [Lineus longissimus]|uniref:neural cell adhesion molecule 1-like isoform X2 n=1 Tax=Lineus longissimus TaxID=88925 RepID=UPI00315D235C